ncbi:MAG TPA: hypothetical protein VE978_07740 [Chitinophagales bacterium]|nr:hypothetical protein [Chitinophagales bacterium]
MHASSYCSVLENYVCYPYPYWFGYPYWYPYYYWYPYPYWFDWGFYYDPLGHIVIIGLPSYYFTYWYFYYPTHYYNYPHLCNTYVNYYYSPRRVVSDNTNVVRGWVNDNRDYLPRDFTANSANRVDAIRQLGHLETDWQTQNRTRKATLSRAMSS